MPFPPNAQSYVKNIECQCRAVAQHSIKGQRGQGGAAKSVWRGGVREVKKQEETALGVEE